MNTYMEERNIHIDDMTERRGNGVRVRRRKIFLAQLYIRQAAVGSCQNTS